MLVPIIHTDFSFFVKHPVFRFKLRILLVFFMKSRIQKSCGIVGVESDCLFEVTISGNSKIIKGIEISCERINKDAEAEPRKICGLSKKHNQLLWQQNKSSSDLAVADIGVGSHDIIFLDLDSSIANDETQQHNFIENAEKIL